MSDEPKTQTFNTRMDTALIAAIDRRAKEVNLSRNEWITRCARWAIHNLPSPASGSNSAAKRKFAASAPDEVRGKFSEDMGLDMPEGKP